MPHDVFISSRRGILVFYGVSYGGGGGNTPLVPPLTWFFDIFFNSSRMYLRLCRPLTQLRIHFLRAWGPHDNTATSSSRSLIFANLGKCRQNWRFLDLRPPSFLGESAVWKFFIWCSIQTAKNVQELSFGSSLTLLVSLNNFSESKNVFNFKVKILIFPQLPSLTAIKDQNVSACKNYLN